jgi:peptidyl-prolyl cis-trans isomerase SurA
MSMRATRRVLVAVAALAASVAIEPSYHQAQAASEIAAVVNKTPITSNDVARRAAFLRLQRQKADTKTALNQLVEETLKRDEIARMRMSVSTSDVDQAFERFAASNKLSPKQMEQILGQAGVGVEHFKAYIAVQMSWPRLVNARYGGNRGRMSSEDLVKRMMENNGQKPVTTEYFLQQIIFVVPDSKRNAILGKRRSEAENARGKFPGCEQGKQFAATMLDVSVRDLGRVLAPELPPEWKPLIEKTSGTTTGTLVTPRGVEFLAICKQRQVSDDHAAEVVFRAEDLGKQQETGKNPNDEKYLEELRGKAQIAYR